MNMPLLPAGIWQIDTGHTQIGFSIRHLGISTVRGLFTEYSGQATIGTDLASSSVELAAATGSVNTGNSWRDEHLVSELFFASESFPEMTFRSTSVETSAVDYRLIGSLTIKAITKPVTFDLQFSGTAIFPMDDKVHAGFLATTTIRRSDFDVSYGIPIAGDAIAVRIDAQLLAPDA